MAPNEYWLADFQDRMRHFEAQNEGSGVSLSIKVRVDGGCFCASCCPAAHKQLNDYLAKYPLDRRRQEYIEHETGPEFLVYLSAATAGASLAAAIVNLIANVIKARSEGRKQGDKRTEPVTVIIRGIGSDNQFFEREVLTAETVNRPKLTHVKDKLTEAIDLIAAEHAGKSAAAATNHPKPSKPKRQPKKRRKK